MLRRKEEAKKQQDIPDRPPQEEPGAKKGTGQTGQAEVKMSHKKKDLLDKLQRVTADFANYQKRMTRNAEESQQWAKAEIIKSILPAIDDFEQALEAGKTAKDVQSLLDGFKLVHDHLLAMLGSHQVETIASEGQKFDPAVHEALLQQESEEHEPGMVIAELRKGYTMNGRTLRPARVVVSKGPKESEESKAQEQQDSLGQDNEQ